MKIHPLQRTRRSSATTLNAQAIQEKINLQLIGQCFEVQSVAEGRRKVRLEKDKLDFCSARLAQYNIDQQQMFAMAAQYLLETYIPESRKKFMTYLVQEILADPEVKDIYQRCLPLALQQDIELYERQDFSASIVNPFYIRYPAVRQSLSVQDIAVWTLFLQRTIKTGLKQATYKLQGSPASSQARSQLAETLSTVGMLCKDAPATKPMVQDAHWQWMLSSRGTYFQTVATLLKMDEQQVQQHAVEALVDDEINTFGPKVSVEYLLQSIYKIKQPVALVQQLMLIHNLDHQHYDIDDDDARQVLTRCHRQLSTLNPSLDFKQLLQEILTEKEQTTHEAGK